MINWYGLSLGIGIVVGISFVERRARQIKFPPQLLQGLIWTSLVGGVLGARLYHVMTDFYLYQENWLAIFQIWNGGLSIIGGVIGGILGAVGYYRWAAPGRGRPSLATFLDLVAFGLPVGQALGRWGNFFNQELYGLPTNLPWAIKIEPPHRVIGFESYSHFHPLFLYESLLMILFTFVLWWGPKFGLFSDKQVGSGFYIKLYIFYYSFIRFWLDFIRIDKSQSLISFFGKNQLFLLATMVGLALVEWYRWQRKET